jgi:hypothetical protein
MADTYTTRNRFEKMEPGAYADTWASRANGQFGSDLLDAAMDGVEGFALSGSLTLTTANGSSDQARKRVLNVTSGTGGTITIPNLEKAYLVRNASSGNVIITTGSGTTATIKSGNVQFVFCDGSNACYAAKVLDFGSDNITTTGTATLTSISCPGAATFTRGWDGTSAQIKFSPSNAAFINFGSNGSGPPANSRPARHQSQPRDAHRHIRGPYSQHRYCDRQHDGRPLDQPRVHVVLGHGHQQRVQLLRRDVYRGRGQRNRTTLGARDLQ